MFKKCMFIFLICLFAIVYADSGIGNVGSVVAIPSSKNMEGASLAPAMDVKYAVYNYQMKPAEFAKFLEINNVSLTALQKGELDTLSQKLAKEFSNKFSGGSTCRVNNDLCAGGSMGISDIPDSKTGKPATASKISIFFKIFNKNKEFSAKVISDNIIDNHATTLNLISLKSE